MHAPDQISPLSGRISLLSTFRRSQILGVDENGLVLALGGIQFRFYSGTGLISGLSKAVAGYSKVIRVMD